MNVKVSIPEEMASSIINTLNEQVKELKETVTLLYDENTRLLTKYKRIKTTGIATTKKRKYTKRAKYWQK